MPKPETVLSAHIGYLFADLPLRARLAAAAQAGFGAVEHPYPQAIAAPEMARLLADNGLGFAQLAVGFGDARAGEKGLAALPGREAEFRADLMRGLDYAEAIGCPFVHPMAGVVPVGTTPQAAGETYRRNIDDAVSLCRGRDVAILVEAISHAAVPGYFMARLDAALTLAEHYEPGELMLLLDTYHAACSGEDAEAFLRRHVARIGHIHIADSPGRHEPGTGMLDFLQLLDTVRQVGFGGAIGFEYVPSTTTAAGLGWLPALTDRLAREREGN